MDRTPRSTKALLALVVFALCAFAFASCKSTGGGLPVVACVDVLDANGARSFWIRTDGDVVVAKSAKQGKTWLRDKATGLSILGPFEFNSPGDVVVSSRTRGVKLSLADGARLPAWVAGTSVFIVGEAELLGLAFEPEAPPTAPVAEEPKP